MTLSEAASRADLVEDGDTLIRERWTAGHHLGVDEKGLFFKDDPMYNAQNYHTTVEDLTAHDWLVLPPGAVGRRLADAIAAAEAAAAKKLKKKARK